MQLVGLGSKDALMPMVDLSDSEWAQVMGLLSTAPWRDANPLLMKIGNQLREQAVATDSKGSLPSEQAGIKPPH